MEKIHFGFFAIVLITLTACNNGTKTSEGTEMSKMDADTTKNTVTPPDSSVSVVTPTFTNLDTKVSGNIKAIVDHYLHIKNALTNDNASEAANGGKEMAATMNKIDKSLFTTDEKKVYGENEDDLKENAEHISNSSNDIAHQREHFSMMSEDIYSLVKAFGGGKTLYHDYCPMYNNNKGAIWTSETIEIKNPYMGSKMPRCGKLQEEIKQAG